MTTPTVYNRLSVALNTRAKLPVAPPSGTMIRVVPDISDSPTKNIPEGTPAWVDYITNTIYLDTSMIYGEGCESVLEDILMYVDAGLDDTPMKYQEAEKAYERLLGFLSHETSHAWHSRWSSGKPYEERLHGPVSIMEEVRVETKAIDVGGYNARRGLRRSFAWLLDRISGDEELPSDPASIARLWSLVVGRYKSGIAMWDEVEEVDRIARSAVGDKNINALGEILDEAVMSDDFDHRLALAEEWLELFPQPEGETVEIMMGCGGHDHQPEDGDDEGDGAGKADGKGDEDGKGKAPGAGNDEDDSKGQSEDDQDAGESAQGGFDPEAVAMIRKAMKKSKDLVSQRKFIDKRGKVLVDSREAAANAMARSGKRRRGDAHRWSDRPPTAKERIHARKLAKVLTNLALPSINRTHRPSTLPPGRLRGRGAVQQAAEMSKGLLPAAEPWRRTVRTRTTTKPVIVGCMTDVSGSMSWAQEFVATFAWVVATAGKSIGARTAAITFGVDVDLITKPGDTPRSVVVRNASDGSEAFNKGAATLDGLLRFEDTVNAAKVLFVVSDGYFVGDNEVETAVMWIEKLTKAGTTIVWINGGSEYYTHYEKAAKRPGAIRNMRVTDEDDYYYRSEIDMDDLFRRMEATIIEVANATRTGANTL